MGFYEEISKYYDYIFPTGDDQLNFVKSTSGHPPKRILDVACGSGGYTLELAKSGYQVTAVDLDEAMVQMANRKIEEQSINAKVFKCNMLELTDRLSGKYECIFCIGNSIVHLGSKSEILRALKQMYSLMEPGGALLLQIINYDRVIKYGVNELPTIKNEKIGLEFIRKYSYDRTQNLIHFETVLIVENSGIKERYENSINLFPLLSSDLEEILKEAGFKSIILYGDFSYSPFTNDSYMLVTEARK